MIALDDVADVTIQREEAAQRIRALIGVTDDDAAHRRRRAIRHAAKTGLHCAKCERELTPNEPVWRAQMSLGRSMFGAGWYSAVAPYCKGCRPKYRQFQERPKPCCGCGRPVRNEWNAIRRRYTSCSEACSRRVGHYRARMLRAEAPGWRECAGCGSDFDPARTDAKFCSVACKQKAYRRVTDNAGAPGARR